MSEFQLSVYKNAIGHCRGTSTYFRYINGTKLTDGSKLVADMCQAYWLMDAIASYQTNEFVRIHDFQEWTLKKFDDDSAILICSGDEELLVVEQKISYTNFPMEEMILYCSAKIIFHPNEN